MLDTNVLVSGLARYEVSATFGVIQAMGRKWDLAITPPIFLEYEDVLGREGIRRLTGLTTRELTHVLEYIAYVGLRTCISYSWRPNLVDESDNKFVDCAVASGADYLLAGNVKHYRKMDLGPFEFEVVTPREFLKTLGR